MLLTAFLAIPLTKPVAATPMLLLSGLLPCVSVNWFNNSNITFAAAAFSPLRRLILHAAAGWSGFQRFERFSMKTSSISDRSSG